MVLRNSGRVGSRRFFSEGSPCNPEYGGKGIFAFKGIGRNWKGEKKDGSCENGEGRNAMQRDSAACFSHLNSHISILPIFILPSPIFFRSA